MGINAETLNRLKDAVGPRGWSDDPNELAPHLTEWRGKYQGATPLLLKPTSTAEVQAIVRICAETQTPLVPQGGNTGLVGGQIPDGEVLLSLKRMSAIRALDPNAAAITVEAGCALAAAKAAAAEHGLLISTSLASEGTATIGGIISTNAGGTNVLRYGMTRDSVLGLEVVTASGEVWDGLTGLRKDNTGYDLKQLFIGAEGTLGVITAATLKLFPAPRAQATFFCAANNVEDALALLSRCQTASGARVSAFELIPRIGLEFVLAHVEGARDPLDKSSLWYVLGGIDGDTEQGVERNVQAVLTAALEEGLIADAALAQSEAQAQDFWQLRERLSEVQKHEGGSIKHDVSVPLSTIPAFLKEASAAAAAACPGIRPVPFGHLGDGNIHFNLTQPVGADKAAYLERWEEFNRIVHDIVAKYGGSISAEHGLGQLKREEILRYKSPVEIEMMKGVKRALDPLNIMNPGKVLTLKE